MPHRGKLNVLTSLLGCPPSKIFMKFRGLPEFPASTKAMCDIAQHFSKTFNKLFYYFCYYVKLIMNFFPFYRCFD